MKSPKVKQFVLDKYLERSPHKARTIPGFRGYLAIIHDKPWRTSFDAPDCLTDCFPGLTVLSAYDGNRITTVKPWRCKRYGEEYGAEWLALRSNNGKKKYFKVETLALELFGQDWIDLKRRIASNETKETLNELF